MIIPQKENYSSRELVAIELYFTFGWLAVIESCSFEKRDFNFVIEVVIRIVIIVKVTVKITQINFQTIDYFAN